jgi:hypothetical protein
MAARANPQKPVSSAMVVRDPFLGFPNYYYHTRDLSATP